MSRINQFPSLPKRMADLGRLAYLACDERQLDKLPLGM